MCQSKKFSFSSPRSFVMILVVIVISVVIVDSKSVRKDIDRIHIRPSNPEEAMNNILSYLYPTAPIVDANNNLPSFHHRAKRSPYPPGYIMWQIPSAVSESLPCICTPGDIKCRCLKQMERISLRKHGKIRVIRSKSRAKKA